MWLPGRSWLARFRPAAVGGAGAEPFAPPAVGPDRAGRAAVGRERVEPIPPAAVAATWLPPGVAGRDAGFAPVEVRAYPPAALGGAFAPLADRAADAREAADPPLRRTPFFRSPDAPGRPPRRRKHRPPAAPAPTNWDTERSRAVRRVPRVSAEQTLALLTEVAALGPVVRDGRVLRRAVPAADRAHYLALRNRLVEAHLRLVLYLIGRDRLFARSGSLRWADLVQEGVFGLARAVELFDPTRGVRFATYALHWVRQSLTRAAVGAGGLVRLPVHLQSGPRRLTRDQLAPYREFARVPRSYPAPRADDPAVAVAAAELEPARRAAVADVLQTLPARLREVVAARFDLDGGGGRTLRELGETFEITRERVRQLEAKALERLARSDRLARLDAAGPG